MGNLLLLVLAFACHQGFWGKIQWVVLCLQLGFFFFFFQVKTGSAHQLYSFTPGSVHSGPGSWDNGGWVLPDELHVTSFPSYWDKFPHYAETEKSAHSHCDGPWCIHVLLWPTNCNGLSSKWPKEICLQKLLRRHSSVGSVRLTRHWGRFNFLVQQSIFLPESTFSADSLMGSIQPSCAVTCTNTCAHMKDPKP